MNRKLRRASQRGGKRPAVTQAEPQVDPKFIEALLAQGWMLLGEMREEEATQLAIRLIRLQETDETKTFFVDCVKRWKFFPGADEIRGVIARALHDAWAKPHELFNITKGILKSDTVIGAAIQRAVVAWPRRLSLHELLGPTGLAHIAADPLLLNLLERSTVFDLELERLLTSLRAGLLEVVTQDRGHQVKHILGLCCALGRQCFINEYVFDVTADENDRAQKLRDRISRALDVHGAISSMEIALLSSYMQLDCLPAAALLKRSWPSSITSLLEEQIQGPAAERKLRAAIPQLTPIANDTSVRVREQYEENPFPRWVKLSPNRQMPVDEWMPRQFPFSNFRKIAKGADLDVLIAGCGTGHHSIIFAQVLPKARILAVDLSLSSLCYAKEKTRTMGIKNIEYAQADILELGGLDRQFDVISSSGVLHHTADLERGWRTLLRLLQPDGCMQIGIYSERAHRNVIAAQRWLKERGFTPSVESIRQARQELIAAAANDAALADVLTFTDFYSTSEFRDLFLPTQMHRYTIPKIQSFLNENNLEFLGFSIISEIRDQFCSQFSRPAEVDLRLWDKFEAECPDTFKRMYEFWLQKKRA
jgi:ubiquinone/menaquinone biosynthesis C-methylase UbiE